MTQLLHAPNETRQENLAVIGDLSFGQSYLFEHHLNDHREYSASARRELAG